jgi:hypothetical protein
MNASDLFSLIDTNGDGTIDVSELQHYCALLRLPQSSVDNLLGFFGGATSGITRPAFQAALSRQITPADLAPYLPSSTPLPTAAAVEAAFAALAARGAPPGCVHVDDLRAALLEALPALDRAQGGSGGGSARAPRLRATLSKGGGASAPAPQPQQLPPLRERIDALLSSLTLTSSGHVRYSELVLLLMK